MNLRSLGFRNFLEEGEIVNAVFRHPFSETFLKVVLNIIVWAGITWLVHFYLGNYYYDYSTENQFNWFFLVPALIGLVRVFRIFMKWYANAVLMTSESLVFAKFKHIFDRSISRIDYWDLDDVELEKKGVGDYLGNKGDLLFSKVSGGNPEEFKRINNPRKIIRKIRNHKREMLDEKNFTEESALKDLLSQMVQTHVRKNGQPEREEDSSEKVKEKNIAKEGQKTKKRHFKNEIEKYEDIEVEKELDDEGGLEIEL